MSKAEQENIFELLDLDPNESWTFDSFQERFNRLKQKHNSQSLNAPKQETRDKSAKIKAKLDKIQLRQERFEHDLREAQAMRAQREAEKLASDRQSLLTNVEMETVEGWLSKKLHNSFEQQSTALGIIHEYDQYIRECQIEIVDDSQIDCKDEQLFDIPFKYDLDKIRKSTIYELLELLPSATRKEIWDKADELLRQHMGSNDYDVTIQRLVPELKRYFNEDGRLRQYNDYLVCARIEMAWSQIDRLTASKVSAFAVIGVKASRILVKDTRKLLGSLKLSDDELFESLRLYLQMRHGKWLVRPRDEQVTAVQRSTTPVEEATRLLGLAQSLLSELRYADALAKVVEALLLLPKRRSRPGPDLEALKKEIEDRIAEYNSLRAAVIDSISSLRLNAAQLHITSWQKIARADDKELTTLQSALTQAFTTYNDYQERAQRAFTQHDYAVAINDFSQALKVCVDDESLVTRRIAAIQQFKSAAIDAKSNEPEVCRSLLIHLSDVLQANGISDDFGISRELNSLTKLISESSKTNVEIERCLTHKQIRVARKRIDNLSTGFVLAHIRKKLENLEQETLTQWSLAQDLLKQGDYVQSYKILEQIQSNLCVDDTEINTAFEAFGASVLDQISTYEQARDWKSLSLRVDVALESAAVLGLRDYVQQFRDQQHLAQQKLEATKTLRSTTANAVERKHFYEAQKLIDRLAMYVNPSDAEVLKYREKIDLAINEANRLCSQAEQMSALRTKEAVSLYRRTLDVCADHPRATHWLSNVAPDTPKNLRIRVVTRDSIELEWNPSSSHGDIEYVVHYSTGAEFSPLEPSQDTIRRFNNILNGVFYRFYVVAVQDRRSSGNSETVWHLRVDDVGEVTAQQPDDGILLRWSSPKDASRILIKQADNNSLLRNLPGDETQALIRSSELHADNLMIVCRYDQDPSRQRFSPGVPVSITSAEREKIKSEVMFEALDNIARFRVERDLITGRLHWPTPSRQVSLHLRISDQQRIVEEFSRELTGFTGDDDSEFLLPLSRPVQPGDKIEINAAFGGQSKQYIKSFVVPDYWISYQIERRHRLFRSPEFQLVITGHGISKSMEVAVEVHTSKQPLAFPKYSTLSESFVVTLSPSESVHKKSIASSIGHYVRLFTADDGSGDYIDLVNQDKVTDEQSLMS